MSVLMLKVLADFLKVTPDEIKENYEKTIELVQDGIATLESINNRLALIEHHLGIELAPVDPVEIENVES